MTKLEQSQVSVSTQVTKSVDIHCRISSSQFEPETIHWYLQKPNQTLEHLIQITSTRAPAQTKERVMAKKDASTVSSILTINRIQKEDEAVYYCAGWGAQCLDCAVEPHKILSLDLCPPTSFTTQVPSQLPSWAPRLRPLLTVSLGCPGTHHDWCCHPCM